MSGHSLSVPTFGDKVREFSKDYTMLLFLMALFAACAVFVPRFADAGNLMNVLIQISINALLATGMTYVILSDGIDLSVGSVAALAGIVSAATIKMLPEAGLITSVFVILLTAVVVGGSCGLFNAFAIAKLRVPPFIATLAMMNIARGIAYVYTDSRPVFGLPESYGWVGLRSVSFVPVTVMLMILVLVGAHIVLSRTCFGRYVYAVGSNAEVAALSGINVTRVRSSVYVIAGILAALGGVVLSSKLQSGQPSAAMGYELTAIAAVAMGGTSMSGGRGGMIQTIFGLFAIGIINNALSLLGVSSYWQTITLGGIILVAVVIDQNKKD